MRRLPGPGVRSAVLSLATVVLAATVGSVLAADPPPRRFVPVGPNSVNGWVHRVVFDPANPALAWAGCDDTIGLWRSADGGASWTKVLAYGTGIDAWALDLGADGRVYAADHFGTGLKVSTDGGATFVPGVGFETGYVSSISAHPTDPLVAFAAEGRETNADGQGDHGPPLNGRGALYRTADGGPTWARIDGGLPGDAPFETVYVHPGDPAVVFAGRSLDVWRSTDGGATWSAVTAPQPIPGGVRYVGAVEIAASPLDPDLLLMAASVFEVTDVTAFRWEIWRSTDRGASWQPTDAPPGTGLAYYAVVPSPSEDTWYAFGWVDGLQTGMLRSSGSAGAHWEPVPGAPQSAFLGGTFIPGGSGDLLVFPMGEGVLRYGPTSGAFTSSRTGLRGGGCKGFAADAGDPPRWFVACGNVGLAPVVAYSDDWGRTWTRSDPPGLVFNGFHPEVWIENAFLPVLADRTQLGTVLLGGDVLRRSTDRGVTWTDLPEPAIVYQLAQGPDGTIYASGFSGDVHASTDHGQTFAPLGSLGCTDAVARVVADPVDAARVWATCASDDPALDGAWRWDGSAWSKLADPGAPARERAVALAVDPFDTQRLVLVMALDEDAASPGPPDERYFDSHVYRSADGGQSWAEVTPPFGCAIAYGALYLSDAAGHLLVGAISADGTCPGEFGGLWESFDGGTTWRDASADWETPNVFEQMYEDPALAGRLVIPAWYDGLHRWVVPPGEVVDVRFEQGSRTRFAWPAVPDADLYDVTRAPLAALAAGDLAAFAELSCAQAETFVDDPETPVAGEGLAYLVRAIRGPDPGTWGTAGRDSTITACP
ncbi:MAG: hypothetical protein Kow0062_09780 [Acidobacteriota bacterium]